MSNHLAAAAVTATLRKALQTALDAATPGISHALVSTLRPNAPGTELPSPGVNIFLYQVTPSGPLRNIDLPRRGAEGALTSRPRSAMDLHYLISFTGDEAKLEPQFLLGITVRALHSQPVLTRQMIQSMLADPTFDFMTGADLDEAGDPVRFTPMPLSLEELSKLWSVVFQTPYVLSQVYRASVVVIDGDERAPTPLPVTRTALVVDASMGPVLDSLLSQAVLGAPAAADQPILTGSVLVLVGRDLLSEVTRVSIDGLDLEPEPASASATILKVVLPPTVPAGARGVSVVQRSASAIPGQDRRTETLRFQLHPAITASFSAGNVTVGFTPPTGQTQRLTLVLNQTDLPAGQEPRAFNFDVPTRASAVPATSLVVPVPGLPAGSYLVRVRVDGAESLLAADPITGRYNSPRVSVP